MIAREITTGAELAALRGEWAALHAIAGATPFQSPEWLLPWWEHVAEGELLTIAVHDDGQLVALLPLYVWTRPHDGARTLFLLGVSTTDQLDGVFAPGFERGAVAAALARLDALRARWDLADLHQLGPDSPILHAPLPDGWTSTVEPGEPCYALPPGQRLPSKLRKNIRYYRTRAALVGRVGYRRADEGTFAAAADTFFALLRRKWGANVMSAGVEAAHRASLPALSRGGAAHLDLLELDGQPIAGLYALADEGCRYLYLMAWDPEFDAVSPGTLIIAHAVERAMADGVPRVDFLRGNEPYKRLWGVVERPLFRRRFAPRSR